MTRFLFRRFALVLAFLLSSATLLADGAKSPVISNGSTNYSLTAQALFHMTTQVVLTMFVVVDLLYAIASVLAIYNATVIYIKLQTGEEGFTKSVLMLVGAVLFLIFATLVLPSFFGYHYGSEGYSLIG